MLSFGAVVKYPRAWLHNAAAIAYATVGHGAAIALLGAPSWPLRVVGVAFAAHTLMIGTYLAHECMHETIFRDRRWNAGLGAALAWLGGGACAGYEVLRRKHLHHHFDRVDPLGFDYARYLAERPALRRCVVALEWAHFPAVELLLRVVPLARALSRGAPRSERRRALGVIASRALFAGLLAALLGASGLALYAVAYLLFVVAARFFDAFHHSFDVVLMPDVRVEFAAARKRDRIYEQAYTYSNVLAPTRPAWNLLLLNFTYHNAHHAKPGVPWHRLPSLDATLFRREATTPASLGTLLRNFHTQRVTRLPLATAEVFAAHDERANPSGAIAVSLLTI